MEYIFQTLLPAPPYTAPPWPLLGGHTADAVRPGGGAPFTQRQDIPVEYPTCHLRGD